MKSLYLLGLIISMISTYAPNAYSRVLMIRDHNEAEPRMIAIAEVIEGKNKRIDLYTCLKNDALYSAIAEENGVTALLKTCKKELSIQNEEQLKDLIQRISSFTQKSSNAKLIGQSMRVGAIVAVVADLFLITAWKVSLENFAGKFATKKFLSSVPTRFFTSKTDWLNLIFNFGGGGGDIRTYFQSAEAIGQYEKFLQKVSRVRTLGSVGIFLGGTYATYYLITNGNDRIHQSESVEVLNFVSVEAQDFFKDFPGSSATQPTSIKSLITAFRAIGYTNWGKIGI